MKIEEYPLIGRDVVFYSEIEEYLDRRYGGPEKKNPSSAKGEKILRYILEYLHTHKNSTCEELARFHYEREILDRAKLKSITDDVRKFIKGPLISLKIVEKSEPRKMGNKNVEQFSLTPFGVLYVIHLFTITQQEKIPDSYCFDNYGLKTIRNISREYKDLLPLIFGRFDFFEKTIGKNFEYTLGLINIGDNFGGPVLPLNTDLLNESIEFLYLDKNRKKKTSQENITDSISFLVYNNMLNNIELYERKILMQGKQHKKINLKKIFKKAQKHAKTKWKKIIQSDPAIMKWYCDFVNSSIKHYRIKTKELVKFQSFVLNQ